MKLFDKAGVTCTCAMAVGHVCRQDSVKRVSTLELMVGSMPGQANILFRAKEDQPRLLPLAVFKLPVELYTSKRVVLNTLTVLLIGFPLAHVFTPV